MGDGITDADEASAKRARRKAQKKEATARFFAAQKAAGRSYHAEWYAKNREKRQAERRAYCAANREKMVQESYTKADITRLLAAQKRKCAYCRKSLRSRYHVDHITPIAKGGSNWPNNIQLTCVACNLRKHTKHPIDFARESGMLI